MSGAFGTLLVEAEGPILWVRLNRPEVLNAYTAEMGAELVRAIRLADGDDGIKVLVLTGTGRVFCAGADVSAGAGAFDTQSGDGAKNFGSAGSGDRADSDFVAAMMNAKKPLLVAYNGSAAGVGLTLTLPCDIRIAADTARFGCVFTRRGLVPEAGSAWFLPRLVGLARALKWCMTGALVPAAEALEAGLVSELVPAEQVEARTRELALEIAANCSPVALALTRQMLWKFSGQDARRAHWRSMRASISSSARWTMSTKGSRFSSKSARPISRCWSAGTCPTCPIKSCRIPRPPQRTGWRCRHRGRSGCRRTGLAAPCS